MLETLRIHQKERKPFRDKTSNCLAAAIVFRVGVLEGLQSSHVRPYENCYIADKTRSPWAHGLLIKTRFYISIIKAALLTLKLGKLLVS